MRLLRNVQLLTREIGDTQGTRLELRNVVMFLVCNAMMFPGLPVFLGVKSSVTWSLATAADSSQP